MENKKTLSEQLQKTCPIFWRLRKNSHYAIPSVGHGWHDIVLDASQKIEKILTNNKNLPIDEMPYPIQIKEKFGSLRFYWGYSENTDQNIINQINFIIKQAEDKSRTICEACSSEHGKYRDTTPEGKPCWAKTLCNDCWEKQKRVW